MTPANSFPIIIPNSIRSSRNAYHKPFSLRGIVNNIELEQSLKEEFESYLNTISDELKQEIGQLQHRLDSEFSKHKTQIDQALKDFIIRASGDSVLETSFSQIVIDHLKMAREEGASFTARAISEAEKSDPQNFAQIESIVSLLRSSSVLISNSTDDEEVLTSLVAGIGKLHTQFAIYIAQDNQQVCWYKEGDATTFAEAFESNDDGIVSLAFKSGVSQDSKEFSKSAIPVIVRGCSVAVVFLSGLDTRHLSIIESIELLTNVAGLTLELLAARTSPTVTEEVAENEVPEIIESTEKPVSTAPEIILDPEHQAALRFARLLVSEIKLYNEDQIIAGSRSGSLYPLLIEPIKRSFELYSQRIPEEVRSSSNYFNDELVRILAAGDPSLFREMPDFKH